MLTWLLLGIVVYYVQVFLPATAKYLILGTTDYMGSRDNDPELTGMAGRLERAHNNMRENFPIFGILALATMITGTDSASMAILGAQIFVIARALYIPLYAFAVPYIRSLAAVAGWVGMILMVVALLNGGA